MGKTDFGAGYFTPAFKPRLKPKLGGRITPYGITKTRIKPRILPTPIKGITSRTGGVRASGMGIAKPSTSSLLKATHQGTAFKPPKSPAAPKTAKTQTSSSSPKPAGYKPPTSAVPKSPGSGPAIFKAPKTKMPKITKIAGI